MRYLSHFAFRSAAFVLVVAASFSGAGSASAGCLKEYGQCGDCARKAMREAILDLDVGDAVDAYVDAIDCDIDLVHCILYDSHHEYECGL